MKARPGSNTDFVGVGSARRRHIFRISSRIVSCHDGNRQMIRVPKAKTNSIVEHRLLCYTPAATVVRLMATNVTIAWLTSYVLYLSGASEDPRMLLPAWVSIATVRPGLKPAVSTFFNC